MNALVERLRAYATWLHLGFPAGVPEPGPVLGPAGATSVPGLRVAGDLTGVPLLKRAIESGVEAARALAAERSGAGPASPPPSPPGAAGPPVRDLAIVGAGPAGIAAALEARRLGLDPVVLEARAPFATIADFPVAKPIFAYPLGQDPPGPLQVRAEVKEALLAELEAQRRAAGIEPVLARVEDLARTPEGFVLRDAGGRELVRARTVLLALGRTGAHRALGVPGEGPGRVFHRLHDPKDFAGGEVTVVGGGDSALETALALHRAGAKVTLVHRGREFTRPKAELRAALEGARPEGLDVLMGSRVARIEADHVVVEGCGEGGGEGGGEGSRTRRSRAVFAMTGRDPPLALLRRAGVAMRGEWTAAGRAATALFLLAIGLLYHWKAGGALTRACEARGWFPFLAGVLGPGAPGDPAALATVLRRAAGEPGFWFSFAYSAAVLGFGLARVRRRRTPYVTLQTAVLVAIQVGPLFLLPYVLLPWAGAQGAFDQGAGRVLADALFPAGGIHGREYWRACGFVLAWPLFLWNAMTEVPLPAWLVLGALQTFVLIPWLVLRYGKGAYCGWICSCGALAETVGDTEREKMPHGPGAKRLELLGQLLLAWTFLLLAARIASWAFPALGFLYRGPLGAYARGVDLWLSGILGVGLYFAYSGRTWCRFACPLAALMNVYARVSRFRILADKPRCISCGVCTAVCHQGVDVAAFAVRGRPMDDPQCVRCSACVGACPTGALTFATLDPSGGKPVPDALPASHLHV